MKRKEPSYRYKYAMLLDDNELDNFINQKIIEANFFATKVYINHITRDSTDIEVPTTASVIIPYFRIVAHKNVACQWP